MYCFLTFVPNPTIHFKERITSRLTRNLHTTVPECIECEWHTINKHFESSCEGDRNNCLLTNWQLKHFPDQIYSRCELFNRNIKNLEPSSIRGNILQVTWIKSYLIHFMKPFFYFQFVRLSNLVCDKLMSH